MINIGGLAWTATLWGTKLSVPFRFEVRLNGNHRARTWFVEGSHFNDITRKGTICASRTNDRITTKCMVEFLYKAVKKVSKYDSLIFLPSSLWRVSSPFTPWIGVLLDEKNYLLLIWGACSRSLIWTLLQTLTGVVYFNQHLGAAHSNPGQNILF